MDDFCWGREVVIDKAGPFPVRHYAQRRNMLAELLLDAERWQDREYLIHGLRRISYREHANLVERLAALLNQRGVGPGKPVMLLAANGIEWVVAFWAVLRVGGCIVSANSWWKAPEVAHALNISNPFLVVADDARAALLPPGAQILTIQEISEAISSSENFDQVPSANVLETDPAIILFTSGTSGASKAAILSHGSQIANIQNLLGAAGRLPQDLTLDTAATRTLLSSPLFHIAGIQLIMMIAVTGGAIIMTEGRFDSRQILQLIEEESINRWGAVPTMLTRLMASPDFDSYDLSSLSFISTGGMRVPPELVEQSRQAFPALLGNMGVVYGLSEAGGTLTSLSGVDYVRRPTSAGRPFPTVELKINDPDSDGVGEILGRSPTNMSGYLNMPEGSPIDADGWLHTGDLGNIDSDGYLHVRGRSKEVIIRGGENIAAGYVESCIMELPEVLEVAVVGLDHLEWGEEVGAVVVPRFGRDLDPGKLEAHCASKLAHFAVPSKWWIRSEPLPTNDAGKVVKPRLKAEWPT
jgi:long-chain acyl-CoA synthetase